MPSRKDLANAIRFLSIDAIEHSNSGHPGAPMGMADIAEVLWRNYLNHNPNNPLWINRDRFVLSNGHSVMLLYSLLHLTGYNLTINDIKKFRKIFSNTPGHPEFRCTLGVETSTGPLGQGLANAVGMAIAEKTLGAQFNKPGYDIINHYTYVFVGDGCLMEGISHEVCSLAGTLQLKKLIVFYDNNGISIDGKVKHWFNDNTKKRFESYGWNVIDNIDGHNYKKIQNAINQVKSLQSDKPSLLICNTTIAFGSPNKSGKNISHGTPLGETEILLTRKQLNWNYKPFDIPEDIYKQWDAKKIGDLKELQWANKFNDYCKIFPKLAEEFKRRINNKLPTNWKLELQNILNHMYKNNINLSTREASHYILEKLSNILPELLGGSADLASSNLTLLSNSKPINKFKNGNYIYYGVREFGMMAISNGIALYKGFIPYVATFLVFMDYCRNAVRMASLMKIRNIMIYTHDSIGVGEDGPTHQPIEQLSSLRLIPNISIWRPCDKIETLIAWQYAIENQYTPTGLILSRQILPTQIRNNNKIKYIHYGGYILKDCIEQNPNIILIATGSEVDLAVQVYNKLSLIKYKIRVVSMPSTDVFDKQTEEYKNYVLPPQITCRIAIEAGSKDFWYKYVGLKGKVIGINSFGYSGSSMELFKKFGFTVENIISVIKKLLKNNI
ncbi:transketolase [Enterobacteriaceae endosymbiont of Neohaemonia nigricornis]|uniref:transketolase n=1 Tax=Enterobacteriaceae endosymbiont of Neohaemonia nigricornis TaxID=2675792 RepID=UPI001448EAB2|nr:transketolase [Enterobacteriaceae endosymbiont of Neohaemonia nigricornis]QJC30333.1 transketolase [Enterobacteriaceae endosymbiont of Neohaemonia nigricornis]